MENVFLENHSFYRLLLFFIGLSLFWLLGVYFRYRSLSHLDRWRWLNNLALIFLNSFFIKLLLPAGLLAFAFKNDFGLFNYLEWPMMVELFFSVLVLDLVIYFQHLLFHLVPLLWKLHSVHHSDPGFDVTTALRFHPIEIGLSIAVKAAAIFILGLSPLSVLVFEMLLNFSAMFNHSNFKLPSVLEKVLVSVVVTPDFHRVHHSVIISETNSNYGFFLSIWDRVFRTYKAYSKNDLKKGASALPDNSL